MAARGSLLGPKVVPGTNGEPIVMSETRRITDIIIDHCYRRDLGDIPGLAASIREFRLLRPVLITSDGRLVAGRRRLEACKLLGWTTIPVNVVGG
jgi:ParB family chromosome partitioning protein